MKKVFKIASVFFLLWFAIHSIVITVDGLTDHGQKAAVAVVLGTKVNTDGSLSLRLKKRLDKSIELFRNQRIQKIIVSGGFGKEGHWEGTKMKEYLILKSIPSEEILVDNHGDTTEKTVINTLHILDSIKCKNVISISQYFHQTRIKRLFSKHGLKNVESASPYFFEIRDFYSVFREFFAYYSTLL